MNSNRRWIDAAGVVVLVAIALVVLVLGRSSQVRAASQAQGGVPLGEIVPGHALSETFVSHEPSLDQVAVLLGTYARQNSSTLRFTLRRGGMDGSIVAEITLPSATIRDNADQIFSFPPIASSLDQAFTFTLSSPNATPGNAITSWGAPQHVYHEGHAYAGRQPLPNRDLTFQASGRLSLSDWLKRLIDAPTKNASALTWGSALLFLPGLALLSLVGRGEGTERLAPPGKVGQLPLIALDWPLRLGLAPGLSIASLAVGFLWTSAVPLPIHREGLVAMLAVCALIVMGRSAWHARSVWVMAAVAKPAPRPTNSVASDPSVHRETQNQVTSPAGASHTLILCVLAILATATQLAIIDNIAVPFWGDSYEHSVVVQLLLDRRVLPSDWRPYADLTSFTYHFGFHSLSAGLALLTGLSAPTAALQAAQLLVVAAGLGTYAVGRLIGGKIAALAGCATVLFFSPMPTFFVNWGRDTQLAGLVVLTTALVLWLMASTPIVASRSGLVLAGLAVAGLALTHYRVILFFAAIALATGLITVLRPQRGKAGRRLWLWRQLVMVVIALILALPWVINLLHHPPVAQDVTHVATHWPQLYNAVGDLWFFAPIPLVVVGLAGILVSIRQRSAILLLAWTVALILLANLPLAGAPAGTFVNNFAIEISLFLPLALGAGLLASICARYAVTRLARLRPIAVGVLAGALLGASAAASTAQLSILDWSYALVLPSDQAALHFVRGHTPANARFLVESHSAFGGLAAVGSDAGWWLPLLAGRSTDLPPASYLDEAMPSSERRLIAELATLPPDQFDQPNGLALLKSAGIGYVFLGTAGGRLTPADFDGYAAFQPIFAQQQTRVYRVVDNGQ